MKNILLLHGAIGAKVQLDPLAELLQDEFSVYQLDFSGHGGEHFADDFSVASFAEGVKRYIQKQDIGPVHIFGYSMGGFVGMYLALKEPGLIKSICTLATKFNWDEATTAKEVMMLNAETIEKKLPAFAEQLRQRHAPNDWKELLSRTKAMLVEMGARNPLKPEDYRNIQIPVLIMVGDRDKMVSFDETLAVYRALPNGQMAILPTTAHPIEQADIQQLVFQIKSFSNSIS